MFPSMSRIRSHAQRMPLRLRKSSLFRSREVGSWIPAFAGIMISLILMNHSRSERQKRTIKTADRGATSQEGPVAFVKRFLQVVADVLIANLTNRPSAIQIRKYYPHPTQRAPENQSVLGIPPERQAFYILRNQSANDHEYKKTSMAVPPTPLRHGYGDTEEIWLNGGHVDIDKMKAILNSSGFVIQTGYRILELGCASG